MFFSNPSNISTPSAFLYIYQTNFVYIDPILNCTIMRGLVRFIYDMAIDL